MEEWMREGWLMVDGRVKVIDEMVNDSRFTINPPCPLEGIDPDTEMVALEASISEISLRFVISTALPNLPSPLTTICCINPSNCPIPYSIVLHGVCADPHNSSSCPVGETKMIGCLYVHCLIKSTSPVESISRPSNAFCRCSSLCGMTKSK